MENEIYSNKQLIGTGSNGNRVYKVLNTKDGKNGEDDQKYLNEIWKWFTHICLALRYIHKKKIIHRDIKPDNIFLGNGSKIKIGDFGISKVLENSLDFAKTEIGTPYYLSPEICNGEKYNFKSDIWMLGCLLYELCSLKRPFESDSINVLIINILNSEPAPIPEKYSTTIRKLVKDMLKKNPEERPWIDEIFKIDKVMYYESEFNKENGNTPSPLKIIDKNKLKIEVEDDISPKNNNANNTCQNFKFQSKLFLDKKEMLNNKKYTPSYCKNDLAKITKNILKISPMNTPTEINEEMSQISPLNLKSSHYYKSNISTSTANTASDNTHKRSIPKSLNSNNFKGLSNKKGHFRHISINISSMQSPEHKAIYHENIEKIENVEFPKNEGNKKPTLTPTNITSHKMNMNRIQVKETPNTTKVRSQSKHNTYDNSNTHHSIIKQFLIDKFGYEKFTLMCNSIVANNNKIDENKIKEIVGEEYNTALTYIKYIIK